MTVLRRITTLLLLSKITNTVSAYSALSGVTAQSLNTGKAVDLGSFLTSSNGPFVDWGSFLTFSKENKSRSSSSSSSSRSMLILGTYAADFNAIEYAQRLRYYLPRLKQECGITKFGFVLNAQPDAAMALCKAVDLDTSKVQIMVDPLGNAGRRFGVSRGWLADNKNINPFLKLFGMLFGLGAWATLPAVIGGYLGNPFVAQGWIVDALAVGMKKGRWPDNALELNDDGTVKLNKFDELPLVGQWERKPLELATLRLQSMLGISLKEWDTLAPDQESLNAGVLTQLGGCIVCDANGDVLFEWKDPGICAVANFEDILEELSRKEEKTAGLA